MDSEGPRNNNVVKRKIIKKDDRTTKNMRIGKIVTFVLKLRAATQCVKQACVWQPI